MLSHIFFHLHNPGDKTIHDFSKAITVFTTHQIRGSKLFVTVNHHYRPFNLAGNVHCQGCLSTSRNPSKMNRKTRLNIRKSPLGNTFSELCLHKIWHGTRFKYCSHLVNHFSSPP